MAYDTTIGVSETRKVSGYLVWIDRKCRLEVHRELEVTRWSPGVGDDIVVGADEPHIGGWNVRVHRRQNGILLNEQRIDGIRGALVAVRNVRVASDQLERMG